MRSRVNDFAIKLANVNGTGSASANSLIMQAIFRMGVPVSGKNLFPSNIQGLPTWYEIRVNRDGYTARALDYDLIQSVSNTLNNAVSTIVPQLGTLQAQVAGLLPRPSGTWSSFILFDLAPVLAMAAFHRDAPPTAPREACARGRAKA